MSDHGADRRLADRPHHAQQTGGARLFAAIAHVFLYLVLTALIVDVSPPERQERVVGVFSAFMLAGQAGGAAGFGHLAHAVGYGPMFGLLSVLLAGACVLAFRLDR